jgi:hypothetical protein
VQSLLIDRGLSINDKKSAILEGHDPEADLPPDIDAMKIQLLRKRRDELRESDSTVTYQKRMMTTRTPVKLKD